jgi:flavin-dependent dehydrogenase
MLARTLLSPLGGGMKRSKEGPDPSVSESLGAAEEVFWDAVVIGAGPAGSMTAYELSRLGKRVLLLDRGTFPRWKVCGATLSPGARDLLVQVGVGELLRKTGATPLHTLRLGGWSIEADLPLNGPVALSRVALDAALIDAAVGQGTRFIPGTRVRLGALREDRRILDLTRGQERMEVSTRVVVAADGLGSGILAQAGVPAEVSGKGKRPVIGLGAVFPGSAGPFETGVIHMAVGEGGYVGMVRVEDGSLNVAAAVNPGALKEAGSPEAAIASILAEGEWPPLPGSPPGGWKGTPELTRRPRRPGAERLFAVGDASGYVEPFTGEGIFWARSGARLLAPHAARAGARWDPGLLTGWSEAHAHLIGRAQRLCRATSWVMARPLLSRSLLRVLKTHPRLVDPVVRRVGAPIPSLV